MLVMYNMHVRNECMMATGERAFRVYKRLNKKEAFVYNKHSSRSISARWSLRSGVRSGNKGRGQDFKVAAGAATPEYKAKPSRTCIIMTPKTTRRTRYVYSYCERENEIQIINNVRAANNNTNNPV